MFIVCSSSTSGYFNTLEAALDLLINLRNHLLQKSLQLFFVFALVLFSVWVILEHVFEKLIMTLLTSSK
jgi:flagellar biogenesis protein FliO